MKIALDGHSSCGKSTLAKAIAKEFNFIYIDSGAMYRCVTLFAMEHGISDSPEKIELAFVQNKIEIAFENDKEAGKYITFLNGKNVENRIRGMEISENVSKIAAIPSVRKHLVDLQRKLSENLNVVMDGRDIGTVVFPDAELKIFLTAQAEIRAKRRFEELKAKNEKPNFDEVLKNVKERDIIDSTRETDPLRQAEDAILLDNSFLSIEEQNKKAFEMVRELM